MFYCAVGTIDPEPRRTQITALARQPWSLHVLSRDCLFLLLTSGIRLGCFANSRVICPACSQQVLCVPVMFPKLSPRPSQTGKESPGAHCPCAASPCFICAPKTLPLSGAQCLFVTSLTHSENSFLRKDLINSFILRHKWLVMLIGLSSLCFPLGSAAGRGGSPASVEGESRSLFPSSLILRR